MSDISFSGPGTVLLFVPLALYGWSLVALADASSYGPANWLAIGQSRSRWLLVILLVPGAGICYWLFVRPKLREERDKSGRDRNRQPLPGRMVQWHSRRRTAFAVIVMGALMFDAIGVWFGQDIPLVVKCVRTFFDPVLAALVIQWAWPRRAS